jgi:hypothetical protein
MNLKHDPDLEPVVGKDAEQAATAKQKSQRQAIHELSQRWGQKHAARVDELARELSAGSPDAGADEKIVQRLAASSTAVAEVLHRAQLQLAERLERFVDDPKTFLMLAKSLQALTTTQSSTMRSVQELLSAAATVRAQRRLVDSHAKRTWHEDVGGGSFRHARRDPSTRHPASN